MKKELSYSLTFAILIISSAFMTVNEMKTLKMTEAYKVAFTSDNPSGIFKTMTGDIIFDEGDLANSSFNMTVDVNSINTGNGVKNRHAKSDKWFDAENYPVIKYNSTGIIKTSEGYETTGMLEMHGITKEVRIPFTYRNNIFSGAFKVSRVDFGIGKTTGMSTKAATILTVDITVPVN